MRVFPFLCTVPELGDLVHELQEVNDWVTLGLYLGIKMSKLQEIEEDHPNLARRRIQMLQEWQNNVTPTWSPVVQALVGIGKRRLAYELAQKHGWLKDKKVHIMTLIVSFYYSILFLHL